MLRRIPIVAVSAAMLALSALPASAATMQSTTKSTTHKISFPGLNGIKAWGSYTRSGKRVHISVCAKDTAKGNFAVGAVTLASNSNNSRHSEQGAVAIGYHETVCRSEYLHYTNHLRAYTFIANNKGKIPTKSKTRTIY